MCASPLPSFSTDLLAYSTTQNIIPLACWRKVSIRKYMKKLHKLKISCAWAPSLFSIFCYIFPSPPTPLSFFQSPLSSLYLHPHSLLSPNLFARLLPESCHLFLTLCLLQEQRGLLARRHGAAPGARRWCWLFPLSRQPAASSRWAFCMSPGCWLHRRPRYVACKQLPRNSQKGVKKEEKKKKDKQHISFFLLAPLFRC